MSEQAVATMGRCGCGCEDQAREEEGGLRVASGVIEAGIFLGVWGCLRVGARRCWLSWFGIVEIVDSGYWWVCQLCLFPLSHWSISMLHVVLLVRLRNLVREVTWVGFEAGDVGGHDSNPEILDLRDTTSSVHNMHV